jgi:peptidoglycan/LPS O-acetylase OafA/YrhL
MNFGSTLANNIGVLLILTMSVLISKYTYEYIEKVGQNLGATFRLSPSRKCKPF